MTGADRTVIDARCREIDVRKKLDGAPADAAAVVETLLGAAATATPDGWDLKCVNSALKALDLRTDIPGAGELRVRAIEMLDRARPDGDA
jgi:hypothetical protein